MKLIPKHKIGKKIYKADNGVNTYEFTPIVDKENQYHSEKAQEYFNKGGLWNNIAGGWHWLHGNDGPFRNINQNVTTGVAPTDFVPSGTILKAAKIVGNTVKSMKTAKTAKTAVSIPKDIMSSGLTRSSKANINAILEKLPEAERKAVTEALLKNENFWKNYGDGVLNVSPSRAAGTINAIRRKLGFKGSAYQGQVQYGNQMSGYKAGQIKDATRHTVGHQRTTRLKPDGYKIGGKLIPRKRFLNE